MPARRAIARPFRLVLVFVLALVVAIGLVAGCRTAPRPSIGAAAIAPSTAAPVVVLSLDGWRWDYHMRAELPAIRRLMDTGVRAEGLIPAFPTKTFPNHYTIVTGLYPGHHGVVGNSMVDPAIEGRFS